MLSISNPMTRTELKGYFQNVLEQSYYDKNLDERGRWAGEGAVRLGLTGNVQHKQLGNLLDRLSPNGREHLVQNAQRPDRAVLRADVTALQTDVAELRVDLAFAVEAALASAGKVAPDEARA